MKDDLEVSQISIDSRTIKPGELYLAIKGHSLDGHLYIQEAINQGAVAVIVSQEKKLDIPQIVVRDTTIAFGLIAQKWREKFDLTVIGVTGSTGKTSVRNMIGSILNATGEQVLMPEKNFNNQWGLPLTLLQLNSKHRYAVVEMGMDALGEISYLSQMAKPDVAVITQINSCHIEKLGTLDNIAKAKFEIFDGLSKEGTAILNADDKYYEAFVKALKQKHISFGANGDVKPSDTEGIELQVLGDHQIQNAMTAMAVAKALEIEAKYIKQGLESVKPQAGRLAKLKAANGATLIDDTYNAHPVSVRAALKVLEAFPKPRVFVLGDMKELGESAQQEHQLLAKNIATAGVDYLFTYGELAELAANNFQGKSHRHFSDQSQLIKAIKGLLSPEMTVLLKASHSMGLERVVQNLL